MKKAILEKLQKLYTPQELAIINDVFGTLDEYHFVVKAPKQVKENLSLWVDAMLTNPSWLKPIKGKGQMKTSDAQKMRKKATAIWGPQGKGWGFEETRYEVNNFGSIKVSTDSEFPAIQLVFHATFFYHANGERVSFPITTDIWMFRGQFDQRTNTYKYQPVSDTHKMVMTDAMSKALSFTGVGTDLFEGMHDDNKYQAAARDAFQAYEVPQTEKPQPPKAQEDSNKSRPMSFSKDQTLWIVNAMLGGTTHNEVVSKFRENGFTVNNNDIGIIKGIASLIAKKKANEPAKNWEAAAKKALGDKYLPVAKAVETVMSNTQGNG